MNKVIHKKGNKIYCHQEHLIAILNEDLIPGERVEIKSFDFIEGQERSQGDQLLCKICSKSYNILYSMLINDSALFV